MKVETITHYSEDDEECSRDYYSIELFIDGEKVKHYGDAYHDRGYEKLEGFFDAMEHFFPEFDRKSVKNTDIADGEF